MDKKQADAEQRIRLFIGDLVIQLQAMIAENIELKEHIARLETGATSQGDKK